MGLFSFEDLDISVEPPLYKKVKSGRRKILLIQKHGGVLEGIKVVYRNGRVEEAKIPVSLLWKDRPGSAPMILDAPDRQALILFLDEKLRALDRDTKITTERRGY